MSKPAAVVTLALLVAVTTLFAACFTADKEPDDEPSTTDDDGSQDDDAATDDDTDDDAADDDAGDDDAGDDDDFGDDDDTTPVTVSCDDIVNFVYDDCGDVFADKGTADRLNKDEAAGECDGEEGFWICVQECLDEVVDSCSGLRECVAEQCPGALEIEDIAE